MKTYIRQILDDLKLKQQPVTPDDLDAQVLSRDPKQRVRQLDEQAQKNEERQTLG